MENCKCIFATLFSSLLSVLSPSLSSAENYCASVHNAGRRLELLRTEKGVLKRTGVSLEFGLESAASLRTFPFWKGGLKSLFIISQKPVGWAAAARASWFPSAPQHQRSRLLCPPLLSSPSKPYM